MSDEQSGCCSLSPNAQELDVEALPGHLVQCAKGLVEQEDFGLDDQRAGDGNALAHPARELGRPGLLKPFEADERNQVHDGRVRDFQAADLERQPDVRYDGTPRQKGGVLEGDAQTVGGPDGVRGLTVDEHAARGWVVEVGEDAEHCRFATA